MVANILIRKKLIGTKLRNSYNSSKKIFASLNYSKIYQNQSAEIKWVVEYLLLRIVFIYLPYIKFLYKINIKLN